MDLPYAATPEDGRRLRALLSMADDDSIAFLSLDDEVWYASGSSANGEPRSPVVDLIQGIWEAAPDKARTVVRRRILTSYAPAAFERDFVKVTAKKIHGPVPPSEAKDPLPALRDVAPASEQARRRAREENAQLPWIDETGPVPVPLLLEHLHRLVRQTNRNAPRYQSDRPVACVLLDREGRILAQARNTNATNRTLHAEVNLCQGWSHQHNALLPAGSRIVTTLQPCRMCASMLLHSCEDPRSLDVLYLEADEGPMARGTALALAGQERPFAR